MNTVEQQIFLSEWVFSKEHLLTKDPIFQLVPWKIINLSLAVAHNKHHQFCRLAENYHLSPLLIINIDKKPSRYIKVWSCTMAGKSSESAIAEYTYKQAIKLFFSIKYSNCFLPMQLIYRIKTSQSFPPFIFPKYC